jgi:endonuclease YncB( thermonuclease family)
VIDGDTFEARVHVWPGVDVNTKIRLRNIDAPELRARCADEAAKAQASRTALETMLARLRSRASASINMVAASMHSPRPTIRRTFPRHC